jgi:nucleoid DNA-binding protein
MNKPELAAAIATKTGQTNTQATEMISALTEIITQEMEAGNKVTLQGFGSFSSKVRAARTARNPKTGGTVDVPAKRVVKFSTGTGLGNLKV